jgi:glycerol-1-phosphate dehydrogenase [NAD(P)+]
MKIDLSELKKKCGCGREHPIAVDEIVLSGGALLRLPELLEKYKKRRPAVLCDDNTYEAAGGAARKAAGECGMVRFPAENLHADETAVQKGREVLDSESDILIAAGSGTIHDITRYLAHEKGIPFISVPTAASVDGFVSTVAAMTWNGFKKTFPAVSPVAVLADTDIFPNAPYRLTASGVSDLLGKFTALADWKIAHLVTGEYICSRVCRLEEEAIAAVRGGIGKIRQRDPEACAQLMYALLLSGLAMQMVGNSRPASGAEHHISHLLEMEILNPRLDAYHGEKVGVGLGIAAKVYHGAAEVLRSGDYGIPPYAGIETDLLRSSIRSDALYRQVVRENDPDPLAGIRAETLQSRLPEILKVLDEVPSEREIAALISEAGGALTLRDIGADGALEAPLIRLSPYVRNRLTFMRLLKRFRMKS